MVADDNVVIEYAHLEDSVVRTDAEVRDCYDTDKLNEHRHRAATPIALHHEMTSAFTVHRSLFRLRLPRAQDK